jgi:hypothetical protein
MLSFFSMRMFIKEGISIRILPVFIYSLFFFTYICLFFAVKINLANADLGRHIINGFNIVNGNAKQVLYSDFYTYTNPSFPHINHHYLSGVIFYYIYIFSGFVGLSYFYAFLGGTCLFILYLYAYKKVGLILATLSVLLFLPFFSFRTEVRPEVFTYLFFTLHALVLVENRKNLKLRHYVLIFVTQAIGINLHNYAVFSFFIPLVLLVEQFLSKNVDAVKKLMLVFVAQLLGTLANPFGVHILLVPLKPFFGMGVQISENLPLLANTKLLFLSIYVILGIICAFASIFISRNKRLLGVALLTVLFACLSLFMFRIIMLFNIVFFIFTINFLVEVSMRYPVLPLKKLSIALPIILLTMLAIPLSRQFGVGLRPGVEKGGEFIIKNNLVDGRVFNDYNVGGYAIFYLSQKETVLQQGKKVYVHNVPESIPC